MINELMENLKGANEDLHPAIVRFEVLYVIVMAMCVVVSFSFIYLYYWKHIRKLQ